MAAKEPPTRNPSVTILLLLGALFVYSAGVTILTHEPDSAAPPIACGVDPNTDSWPELALLPRMGEVTSRAIVAYREEALRAGATPPVFRQPADLEAVKGIGPKTVQRIAAHLRLEASPFLSSP